MDVAFFGFFIIQIIIRKSGFLIKPVLFWRHFVASAVQIIAIRTDMNFIKFTGKRWGFPVG